jgi:hypothetical protein
MKLSGRCLISGIIAWHFPKRLRNTTKYVSQGGRCARREAHARVAETSAVRVSSLLVPHVPILHGFVASVSIGR